MDPVTEDINLIRKLDPGTARRICSGQVITSMSVAVKELIENALDANATCLSIKFVDYGRELIEVIDNGSGIEEKNFDLLGKRSCTSKLVSFNDLEIVETFGFRGEAISSLCNIARLSIHTRHAIKPVGALLRFDTDGNIINKELIARDVGTSVSLAQLFYPMPVRRKDLISNIRRAFDKTLSLIYQYCIGLIGLRITCSHTNQSGKCSNLFSSNGLSIQSNIIEIFDYKQFTNLMPFSCDRDVNGELPETDSFDITGFISKPDTLCGRSSSDRQYFYLNGRPCDMLSLFKRINQIYRTYNRNQYPFILLKIVMDEKLIDRNLTPDKRQVLLADNHYLFKLIQHSIEQMFCRVTNTEITSMNCSLNSSQSSIVSFMKRTFSDNDDSFDNNSFDTQTNKIFKRSASPCDPLFASEQLESVDNNNSNSTGQADIINLENDNLEDLVLNNRFNNESHHSTFINDDDNVQNITSNENNNDNYSNSDNNNLSFDNSTTLNDTSATNKANKSNLKPSMHPFFSSMKFDFVKPFPKESNVITAPLSSSVDIEIIPSSVNKFSRKPNRDISEIISPIKRNVESDDVDQDTSTNEASADEYDDDDDHSQFIDNRECSMVVDDCSIEDICEQYANLNDTDQYSTNFESDFQAKLAPEENDQALQELKQTLSKQSFAEMSVIGQFNLGFIVAKLGRHLFIIDQHAIDERFNFERFMDNPNISYQNLVCPLGLRLSAISEMTVIDHLDTFNKLGFAIVLNREASVGQRVLLSRIPLGKEWVGGRSDIEEIIAAIRDSPTGDILQGKHFVLSGLRRELAYRACRSSVMIGQALTRAQMGKILSKIGAVRDPWHCAHNRPTIRHLLCLDQIFNFELQ